MFSSQQSDKGQAIIKKFNLEHLDSQTVVLIDNNLVFNASSFSSSAWYDPLRINL